MKKLFVLFIFSILIVSFITQGCSKHVSPAAITGPDHTPTITQTYTPSQTFTPVNTSTSTPTPVVYNFDTDVTDWSLDAAFAYWDEAGISIVHNTDPAYVSAGTGSARVNCDFSATSSAYYVCFVKSFPGGADFEYYTFNAKVYCPAGLVDPVNPYVVRFQLSLSTGSGFGGMGQEITAEGWYDVSISIDKHPAGNDFFQSIKDVGIAISQELSSTVDYVGPIYVDEVTWYRH